jgi:putative alpha-1,2-mannosidase
MVQWSPDTMPAGALERETLPGSYVYRDGSIRGFSLNHLSGVGCPVLADVPILPVAGPVTSSPAVRTAHVAPFSHANEQASPGFYAVKLDSGVKVQLTATTRAGIGRFTFPASADSNLLFDVGQNATGVSKDVSMSAKEKDASIEIVGGQKIVGRVSGGGFCGSGSNKYTVYFVAEFNRPFTKFGTWNDSAVNGGQRSAHGPHTGGFVGFDTTKDQLV